MDRSGGGIAPVCKNGPDRPDVEPFEFVRAIDVAERCDILLARWEKGSFRSYLH